MGMNALLLRTNLTPEQFKFADMVRISAENLLSILNDILDISKLEAGKVELEKIDFSLQTPDRGRGRAVVSARPGEGPGHRHLCGPGRPATPRRRSHAGSPGHLKPGGQRGEVHRERLSSRSRPGRRRCPAA